MQTAWIYYTYNMTDGSSIMDNVHWPACVERELQKEKGDKSSTSEDIDEVDVSQIREVPSFE